MTLLEKMDRFVHVTYLDRIAFADPRPRRLRWIPLFALAGLIGGYVLTVRNEAHFARPTLTGIALFMVAYLAAALVRSFGPRLTPSPRRPLDERELTVKARASAASGTILVILVMAGCFYMGVADVLDWWRPRTSLDWVYLGLGLQGGFFMLPSLLASWLEPRPPGEDD